MRSDIKVLEEIDYFKNNNLNSVGAMVSDDGLLPIFDVGDYVGGISVSGKNIKDLVGMIPGMGKAMKDVEVSDDAFKSIEAIIQSMTLAEREDAALINGNRKKRIADGSGTTIQDVNKLLKQYLKLRTF
jgi:signal recognition particle subunit SRP54